MDDAQILTIVKYKLGLTSDVRDDYLTHIIKAARGELKNSGIDPEGQTESYQLEYDMYLAEYAGWLYESRGGEAGIPRWLQFRRHNLIIGHQNV